MRTRNFNELRNRIAADPAGAVGLADAEARVRREYEAHQRMLAELRRARALTQEQLARSLEASQEQVSRIERQTGLYLATLASYFAAMGGRLELVGVFDDVELELPLSDLIEATSDAPSEREPVAAG
jgi:DNA-binding XRE family transcriptional regulator